MESEGVIRIDLFTDKCIMVKFGKSTGKNDDLNESQWKKVQ